jgi:replicative DNA helicase
MARPSMGKTALALNIAENVAGKQQGKKALYINLESSAEALTRRRLAIGSDIPLSDIRRGILTDNQYTSFISAANEISASNLIIIEKPKFKDIRLLHSIVETFVLEHPISLITIDHFTKLFTSQKTHSSHHQFSLISNEITTIAKDLKVPVLLLCQLNRESEKRTNKRPVLSDLRETGSLEEDADNVIAIYRETKESEVAEIELLKGRDVGTFKTRLKFDRFCQRFDDCDEEESWDQNTAIYRAKI